MLCDCGHLDDIHQNPYTGAHGTDRDGKTFCMACAGTRDRESLEARQKVGLYFTYKDDRPKVKWNETRHVFGRVSNWPGSYSLPAYAEVTLGYRGETQVKINFRTETGIHYHGRIGNADWNQSFLAIPYKNQ